MKRKPTRRRPGRKPKKSTADLVADMAASGLVEDEIAQRLGVHKAGKAAATVSEAEVEALTIEEYYVLSNITNSFASDWYDETYGNLLWAGTADGKGARTVEDAFAAWKQRGGKFNCSGLRSRFNKDKAESLPKSQWTIETNLKQERQDE